LGQPRHLLKVQDKPQGTDSLFDVTHPGSRIQLSLDVLGDLGSVGTRRIRHDKIATDVIVTGIGEKLCRSPRITNIDHRGSKGRDESRRQITKSCRALVFHSRS